MSAISNLPKDLQGKVIAHRQACIDVRIKFGLWKNYSSWTDLEDWHDISELSQSNVLLNINLGNTNIYQHKFKNFEVVDIHHVFNDEEATLQDLNFIITNLDNLPVYDNNKGLFVSGMFQIESVKLQDIDITHLLENTFFGTDTKCSIEFSTPVYSWLVENWPKILPKAFNLPIADIENYNRKNLFFR